MRKHFINTETGEIITHHSIRAEYAKRADELEKADIYSPRGLAAARVKAGEITPLYTEAEERQLDENREALDLWEKARAAMDSLPWYSHKARRFRHCSAEVETVGGYAVLRSYRTLVAAVDLNSGRGVDVLRTFYGYTRSSASQINKFFHDYGARHCLTWRFVSAVGE